MLQLYAVWNVARMDNVMQVDAGAIQVGLVLTVSCCRAILDVTSTVNARMVLVFARKGGTDVIALYVSNKKKLLFFVSLFMKYVK